MDEVVIQTPRPIDRDPTQDTTTVGGTTLRESPRATTFEAMAQESAAVYVPARGVGIHGVASGATGGIRIRGLGGSPNTQVLVVEDGVPDFQGVFGHPIADAYSPTLIDQLLIVKGGDSVLYGTNALAGAIVIRNRWRNQEGWEAYADAAGGSYSTLRTSATALFRSGGWQGAASFYGLETGGHRDGAGGSEAIGGLAVRYWFAPDLSLAVRGKVVHLGGNDPGQVTHPITDHWYDVWRDTASVQLTYAPPGHQITVTPYINVGVHKLYDGFYSRDYVAGVIAEDDIWLMPQLSLLVGLAAGTVGGDVENRITGERPEVQSASDLSAYAQGTWRPVPELTLVLGAREFLSTRYSTGPLYKIGVSWYPLPGIYVHGSIAANFRQPTIRELYLPYPTANPNLRPERALNADLGAVVSIGRFQLSFAGYRTSASDLIRYFGAWPAAEVVNVDQVTIWGVEGSVAVNGLGPFSAHVDGNFQNVGRYTRQNPSARIVFGAAWVHGFGAHLVGANLDGEWVHGLFMADYGRDPIPDVFSMDVALRYRYTSELRGLFVEPYIYFRNFLDQQYAYVAGYVMPGFNVLAGLRIGIN